MIEYIDQPVFRVSYTFRGRHDYYTAHLKGHIASWRFFTLRAAANKLAWWMIQDKYGTLSDRVNDIGRYHNETDAGYSLEAVQKRLARFITTSFRLEKAKKNVGLQ